MTRRASLACVSLLMAALLPGCLDINDLPSKHAEPDGALPDAPEAGSDAGPLSDGGLADGGPGALAILTHTLPEGEAGKPYAAELGGAGPSGLALTFAVSGGALPDGVQLESEPGSSPKLAGTPRVAGEFPLTVSLRAGDEQVEQSFVLRVAPSSDLSVLAQLLPPARAKEAYQASLTVHNAQGAVTWSVVSGALPGNVSVQADASGAKLAGKPGLPGMYAFELEARDAMGRKARRSFSLRVDGAPAWVAARIEPDKGCGPYDAFLLDASPEGLTRHPRSLRDRGDECGGSFQFSPGGQWLYFQLTRAGKTSHALIDLRGDPDAALVFQWLEFAPLNVLGAEPLWSSDGSHLLFWSQANESDALARVVDVTGASPVISTLDGEFIPGGAWSPDGKKLALYGSSESSVRVVSFEGTEPSSTDLELGEKGDRIRTVRFTPDGKSILYERDGKFARSVCLEDLTSAELSPVVLLQGDVASDLALHQALSPEGARAAALEEGKVHALDFTGRFPEVFHHELPGVSPRMAKGAWAVDGTRLIAFNPVDHTHYLLSAASSGAAVALPLQRVLGASDVIAFVRFMSQVPTVIASISTGPVDGLILPRGAIYRLDEGIAELWARTTTLYGDVQYAAPELLVLGSELLDVSVDDASGFPRDTQLYASDVDLVPSVDERREAIYFCQNDLEGAQATLRRVDTAVSRSAETLSAFDAASGQCQITFAP